MSLTGQLRVDCGPSCIVRKSSAVGGLRTFASDSVDASTVVLDTGNVTRSTFQEKRGPQKGGNYEDARGSVGEVHKNRAQSSDEDLEEELPRNEPKGDREKNAKHRRNHRVCIFDLSEFRVRAGQPRQ